MLNEFDAEYDLQLTMFDTRLISLGTASFFVSYPLGDSQRTVGFPSWPPPGRNTRTIGKTSLAR
jgi:hypothetical protein